MIKVLFLIKAFSELILFNFTNRVTWGIWLSTSLVLAYFVGNELDYALPKLNEEGGKDD